MVGIKTQGEFLDVYAETGVTFDLVSNIFTGENDNFLPGSYSFPFDLPLTPKNKILLNFPDQAGNLSNLAAKLPCEIYFNGARLPFDGLGSIAEATEKNVKFYVTIQAFDPLKDIKLNELDLGGQRDLGSDPLSRPSHAATTSAFPLSYDYTFFPVYNPAYWDAATTPPIHISRNIQNFFEVNSSSFISHANQGVATPFVKLEYLLKRIFEANNLHFTNNFQDSDELRLLYLYNNYNIYENGEWGRYIDLRNHVSETKTTDFLRWLMRKFCLAIVKEPFDPVFTMLRCNDLLQQAPATDWTNKAVTGDVITQNLGYFDLFQQKRLDTDGMDETLLPEPPAPLAGTVDTWAQAISQPPGWYYVRSLDAYALISAASPVAAHVVNRKHVTAYGAVNKTLELDLGAPANEHVVMTSPAGHIHQQTAPVLRVPGTHPERELKSSFPDRLLFYRGRRLSLESPTVFVPLAANAPYNLQGSVIGSYSLAWDTSFGVYEKFWKNWHFFLSRKKDVQMRLLLTLPDIMNFRFQHVIRIRNMNYLVKSLRISFTQKGIEPVEAKLVSII